MAQAKSQRGDQAGPDPKDTFLRRIRTARATLEQTLSELDEVDLTRPGADGWSIKDHLHHIAAWLRKTTAVLHGQPGHAALGVPEALYASGDDDAINARLQQRSQGLALAEVLREFGESHRAITAYIEARPADHLAARYNPADPDDERTVREAIAGNTHAHDDEHRKWIERARRKEAGAQSSQRQQVSRSD